MSGVIIRQIILGRTALSPSESAPSFSPIPERLDRFYRVGSGSYLDQTTDSILLIAHNEAPGRLIAVDIDNGTVGEVAASSEIPGSVVPALTLANHVVFFKGGSVYALTNLEGSALRMAEVTGLPKPFPSWSLNSVWLQTTATEVREIDFDGRIARVAIVPEGKRPVAEVEEGLLLAINVGESLNLEIWDPATEEVKGTHQLARGGIVDVYKNNVAWVEDLPHSQNLHLLDLKGQDRIVKAEAEVSHFVQQGTFSPDGTRLAVVAGLQHGGNAKETLAVVDTLRASANVISGASSTFSECYRCLAWAPSGQMVFFLREGPEAIGAYRLGSGRALPLKLRTWNLSLALTVVGSDSQL